MEIIDLSQEIFTGMPVFPGMPGVTVAMHVSHEEWDKITDSDVVSPAVNRLELGEHTGTHVDALNHMAREYRGQSIDSMPLTMFYTGDQAGRYGPVVHGSLSARLRNRRLGAQSGPERGCGSLAGRTKNRGLRRGGGGAGRPSRFQ
jgi:hypothetical protein